MRRNKVVPMVVMLLLGCAAAVAGEINWQPQDFAAAAAKAQAEGKLVYVFVEGDNCPPCDAFKQSHLPDPAFIDYINTLFVPIRAHESDPAGRGFLESLRLTHPAVPRFYVLSPAGHGVSMSIGMVMAPPMGGADMLKLAAGRDLGVNKEAAAALGARLRAHAASQRGLPNAEYPLRPLGLAALEAQAWALAGRLDEAEKAFGREWATQLVDQDVRQWYIDFWLAWRRNLQGALDAANEYRNTVAGDPMGDWLLARAYAANGNYSQAVSLGEGVLAQNDSDMVRKAVEEWRALNR